MKLTLPDSTIPDKLPLLDVGEYVFNIISIEAKAAEGKRGDRFEFKFQVEDGPMKGRTIYESFETAKLLDVNNIQTIRFGNMCKSAGVPCGTGEFDTDQLMGKQVRATVKHRSWQDEHGVTQNGANIAAFLYS